MDDLIAFQRARLDEQDALGEDLAFPPGDDYKPDSLSDLGFWVMKDAEAKRQRIETYVLAVARQRAEGGDYSAWLEGGRGEPSLALSGPDPKLIPGLELAIKQDAQVHDQHPDYQEQWRPT